MLVGVTSVYVCTRETTVSKGWYSLSGLIVVEVSERSWGISSKGILPCWVFERHARLRRTMNRRNLFNAFVADPIFAQTRILICRRNICVAVRTVKYTNSEGKSLNCVLYVRRRTRDAERYATPNAMATSIATLID